MANKKNRQHRGFTLRNDVFEQLKAISARKNMSMSRLVENYVIKDYENTFYDDIEFLRKQKENI